MTLTVERQLQRKLRARPIAAPRATIRADFLARIKAQIESSRRIQFPSPRYQKDPVAFAREILGVEPWGRQRELLMAVAEHPRVACKSGRRVSKSWSAAILALWFYCSFPDAQVFFTSVTAKQVNRILWKELCRLKAGAGRCVTCKASNPEGPTPCPHSAVIDGEIGIQASTGLRSNDFRTVVGFTASTAEAFQGLAGTHLLFIADEASGIADHIFEAIEGNRASGARFVLLGNPTKTRGEFYEAFNAKKRFYKCLTISSLEGPNIVAGRVVLPGLATPDWIAEKRAEWGEDSALYRIHILGEFAEFEDGKIFSIEVIKESEQRWEDTPGDGRLWVGLDPAGPTGSGDETVFAFRRGQKVLGFRAYRGLDSDTHLSTLLALLDEYREPSERPVVVLDCEGSIGSELRYRINGYLDGQRVEPFDFFAVRSSNAAVRKPQTYDRLRDELAYNLEQWMRDGGAIPEHSKLEKDLHALEWVTHNAKGNRLKVTPKSQLRTILGRSPDYYDALALACWEERSLRYDDGQAPRPVRPTAPREPRPAVARPRLGAIVDPYAGWRR